MDVTRWQQVNQIVDTALDIAPEHRSAFVEKQCGDDRLLQTQVTQLLQSIARSQQTGFLENTSAFPRHLACDFLEEQPSQTSSLVGQQVGSYTIIELLAHGGMGSVFLAERADDAFERNVAIKVMRRGMDTPSNIMRFNQERQILATLDHPNIARLLDGGVTDDGLPYLVMEYVDGTPLYEYCNSNRLSVEERLKIFKAIGEAVQHAHTNAVIHRDLKPSNIRVTEAGHVKVLDFGIAKLLEPKDPTATLFQTRPGARLLTLAYAAPEQVEKSPVTTATDTHALGILLCELLSGTHPFAIDRNHQHVSKIERQIRETTPGAPSKSYHSSPDHLQKEIAQQRNTTPANLTATLKGDLDAIITKALRKEPEARYGSVDQMLEDLQRREAHLPIVAREDTFQYNARKFIKRHKTWLIGGVGLLLLTLGFIIFHTWRISKERDIAQLEAQRAESVTTFLTDLIQSNYPENAQGDTITVRQFLDQGYQKVQSMGGTPMVKAEIMNVMGHTYRTLGESQKAKEMITGTLDLLAHHDASPMEQAKASNVAGLIYRDLGKPDTAATYLRDAVNFYHKAGQTKTAAFAKAMRDLAYVEKQWLNNYKEAEEHITEAIAIDKQVNGPKSAELAESYYIYASLLRDQKRHSTALTYQKKSLNILEENIDGAHPGKSANYNNIAILYNEMDSTRRSIPFYRKSMQMNKELYGPRHFRIANNATNLALQFMEDGQLDSALNYNNKAIQIGEETLSEGHRFKIRITLNQARIFNRREAYQKSDSLFRKALAIADASDNADVPLRGHIYRSWGQNAADQNQLDLAKKRYTTSFSIRKKNFGVQDSLSQVTLNRALKLAQQTRDTTLADSLSQFLQQD